MLESITPFDLIAVAIIIISAIMAFARGFLRELATLGAFIGATAAATLAVKFFRDDVVTFLPPNTNPQVITMALILVAFVVVYVIVAWFGQRLSKNIQGLDGIGMLDRLAGLVFGAARGVIALVFFLVLVNIFLEEERIPGYIQDGFTYPILREMSQYVNTNANKVAADVQPGLPTDPETGQ
ncbi:MAG: CvpA family protein [Hyphomonas sp.]